MTKKTKYSILTAVLLILVYSINFYQDKKIQNEAVLGGALPKEATKTFFLPTSTTGQIVHHSGYSLSYSEIHEQAEWVAYELKKEHLSKNDFKRPYFEIDKAVKTEAASWRNYKKSGYDKGHLCPAGDKRYTKEAHDETFLTSNISPQEHKFNAGLWNRIEQKTRYWASRYNGVFVVTGGVLKGNMKTIGDEDVAVPNQFYKIILDYNYGSPKMIAFLTPHQDSKQPLYNYVVSVDRVEALTGIDFFPELDDAIETKIEASDSYKNWRF
ncbi:DNA/RNA non-specific endonuclease [Aurantibacter sp.]|uniref:DNA/RNA non-specific endonuclease n=1 Tax=Aurantibacter sp. TaxID=2807103 RepID=UPI0035C858B4